MLDPGGTMKQQKGLSLFIVPIFSLLFFQGCSESNFSAIDASEKLSTLEGHSGLSDSQDDSGMNGGNPNQNDGGLGFMPGNDGGLFQFPGMDGGLGSYPGTDGGKKKTNEFDKGDDPVTTPDQGRFNVIRWCRGADRGATLKDASDIKIVVKDQNKVVCEATGKDLLDQIKADGMVDIPNCDFSKIPNHRIIVQVTDQAGRTLSDGADNGSAYNAFDDDRIRTDRGLGKPVVAVALHLLMERNVEDSRPKGDEKAYDPKECDAYNASPLVVDMRSTKELEEIFELSAPADGVLFDILGKQGDYVPKQISWMKDPRIMPIVLPKRGKVNGVDQMFGNNTFGPDKEFAEDGFAALAKYDGLSLRKKRKGKNRKSKNEADGYITKDDDIYHKLRVWYDRNLDGVAQRRELYSLKRAGIEVIDLNFDDKYYSQDKYGNEIKYKSVVKLKSGKLKPVFDIWFTVNNLIQKN